MIQTASKTHSAVQMVRVALERAHHYQDTHHIFTFINDEAALAKAAAIDQRIQRGESVGPLAGVPYALKDNFLSPEGETTASAHILEGFTSPVTATAVQKLEDAGAIMIGRTNLDAFAHGSSTENSYFGPTKNSRDPERVVPIPAVLSASRLLSTVFMDLNLPTAPSRATAWSQWRHPPIVSASSLRVPKTLIY